MKSSKLNKLLVVSLLAAGVSVFALSATTLAATTPVDNPPGITISPTFDDVTVTGEVDTVDLNATNGTINDLEATTRITTPTLRALSGTVSVDATLLHLPTTILRLGQLAGSYIEAVSGTLTFNSSSKDLQINSGQMRMLNVVGSNDFIINGMNPIFQSDIEVQGVINGIGSIDISGDVVSGGAILGERVGTTTTTNTRRNLGATSAGSATVSCPVGTQRLSCGHWTPNQQFNVYRLYPNGTQGCTSFAYNGTAVAQDYYTYAICLDTSI